jgi:FlaA1/EpsC-like NDP-sugar epimerase
VTAQTAPPAEQLLGRSEFAGDLQAAATIVRGRRVLITGAAGSVGTPLTRLLISADAERLVLLDQHEHSLFGLERTMGRPDDRLSYELADVRDLPRMERIFREYQPEVVFHLAAAKHVPYGERFPEGAVAVNVLATRMLLEMADRANTQVVIYPSSDKSVQPPSVYGATKRLAEALVQSAAQQRRWMVVRYVNVIGTRGSVIETFTQQVLDGRPLSITDDRMTRYWISMDEALWCALMSVRCAAPGEILMPACGEPVPILETARRLAGWYRPEQVPYPISCTGIRPGERLHEVLLSPNESFAAEGPAAGMRTVRTRRETARLPRVYDVVEQLEVQVQRGDREALARTCLQAADALQ